MKPVLFMTFALSLTLGAFAHAQSPSQQLSAAATQFGLPSQTKLNGQDSKGRPCEVSVTVVNGEVSVEAVATLPNGNVETSQFRAYSFGEAYELLKLEASGSAQTTGIFTAKIRDTVPAHKTDFGWPVAQYKVDYFTRLGFKNGQLVAADVVKDRSGLSKLVLDIDFSGGSVLNCHR